MAKYFKCITNKPAISYECGEKIRFEVYAKDNCQNIACQSVSWELHGDDGKVQKGVSSCEPDKPIVIETTLDRAGFVHLVCKAYIGNKLDDSFKILDASVGAEIEKIECSDTLPEDFCEYWEDIERQVSDFPIQVLKFDEIKNTKQGFKAYDIRIKTPIGRPASAIITMPENEGKYPIRMTFNGYGVTPAMCYYQDGLIWANFNAHGFENDICNQQLLEKYKGEIEEGYGFSDTENASNMTTYWRNMMIRNLIGAKFLKTLENWDGKNFIVSGGSQGALQATTVAAHDKTVTYLEINIPWFCDLKSSEMAYLRGWRPNFAEGLRYFDTAHQAKFVKCPVRVNAHLGDYICPPKTVMALYNGIKSRKTIQFVQGATHGEFPPERETFKLTHNPENTPIKIKKGIYRHFKGNEYKVLDVGFDCETTKEVVVYKALYDQQNIWVRDKADFCDFVYRENKVLERFKFLE